MAEPVIVCRNLQKSFGDVHAVRGLDLIVNRGECFGLLGPNGAGKTTTIEILEGLQTPSSGSVTLFGQSWDRDEQAIRERVGITLQETRLADKLTVRETFQLFRSLYPRGPTAEQLLSKVGLEEKANARYETLSGGQKQRVAVGCALAGEPDLLFLDEPTTGLDPQSRRNLWDLVIEFRRNGGTVLLTTHYMDEAEKLCDRVAIVDHGKAIALGTPAELIEQVGGDQVIDFAVAGDIDSEALEATLGAETLRREADGFVMSTQKLHATLPSLIEGLKERGVQLERLSTHRATLEDVFVQLTGKRLRD